MDTNILNKVGADSLRKTPINFKVGDKVKVHTKIKDLNGYRSQIFEGFVISIKHGSGLSGTYTVRKVGKGGVAVEKTFRVHSEFVDKVEVVQNYKARRAKLHYIRDMPGDIKLRNYGPGVKAKGKRIEFDPHNNKFTPSDSPNAQELATEESVGSESSTDTAVAETESIEAVDTDQNKEGKNTDKQ
jgi:large subunit ribosomal protein L19